MVSTDFLFCLKATASYFGFSDAMT